MKDIKETLIPGEWDSFRFYDQADKSDPLNDLRLLVLRKGDTYHRVLFTVGETVKHLGEDARAAPPSQPEA